ncbi:MAG: ribulose-phosphate 3-epimerase [Spirochaetota bacterium]
MEFKLSVSPSLLAADYGCLGKYAIEAESGGAGSLHLDYMDGHYVPNISFGIDLIPALKKRVSIPLISHLMISNANERLEDFIRVTPDYIVLQEDAVRNTSRLLRAIKEGGIKPGLAINPARSLKKIYRYIEDIDYLLILSVNPGFGGQKFIESTLNKIEEAHQIRIKNNLKFDVAVDGGVNIETAKSIVRAGANILVAGTAIFCSANIHEAIENFLSLEKS